MGVYPIISRPKFPCTYITKVLYCPNLSRSLCPVLYIFSQHQCSNAIMFPSPMFPLSHRYNFFLIVGRTPVKHLISLVRKNVAEYFLGFQNINSRYILKNWDVSEETFQEKFQASFNMAQNFDNNYSWGFLWRLVLALYCLRLCPSVCQSRASPHNNSPVQPRLTKFRPELQNTLVKVPIVLGAWKVKFYLITKSCIFASVFVSLKYLWHAKSMLNCSTSNMAPLIFWFPKCKPKGSFPGLWITRRSVKQTTRRFALYFYKLLLVFTGGQLWPSGIWPSGNVAACVCLCGHQSRACPRDLLWLVPARITKFEPDMQNILVKIPIVLGVGWPWPSRSNLTWKSKFTLF